MRYSDSVGLESESKLFPKDQCLANRLVTSLMWAMSSQLSAERMDFSQSFANLRHLPSHAKVRSTTQRRGMTSKPFALSERLTISIVQQPIFSSLPRNFGPP